VSCDELVDVLVCASVLVVVDGLGVCARTTPANPSAAASPSACNLIMVYLSSLVGG
jgi:hypothetical protein